MWYLTIYLIYKTWSRFHTNIIAYCQQNRYVQLAIYTDLFFLGLIHLLLSGYHKLPDCQIYWEATPDTFV